MDGMIFENGAQVGTCKTERQGLYRNFSCQMEKNGEHLYRIYVLSGYKAEYLGIADRQGRLFARLPEKRLPHGVDGFAASTEPRGDWQPWHGTPDGIAVDSAFVRQLPEGFLLALPPAQALQFPEWIEQFDREVLFGAEYAVLRLNADGQLPLKEKDNGGLYYEADAFNFTGDGVPADTAADVDFSEQGG